MSHGAFRAALGRVFAALVVVTGAADAEDGELDLSFGTRGMVATPVPVPLGTASQTSMALQADGRILVAGSAVTSFHVLRHLPDGSLDPSFGSGGIVSTAVGDHSGVTDIALQGDGRIVAAGYTDGPAQINPVLARYLTDGTLDATFGTAGIVTTPIDVEFGHGALALQGDDRIVLAVTVADDLVVLRYLGDGTPDATFDGDGMLTLDFDPNEFSADVLAQPDGKIVLLGYYSDGGCCTPNTRVIRLAADGSFDSGFGSGGTTQIPGMLPGAVELLAGGGLLLAGAFQGDPVPGLARLTAGGLPDSSFGNGGLVVSSGLGRGEFHDLLEQTDGRIVAAGQRSSNDPDFLLARYDADGAYDATFARCGATVTSVSVGTGGNQTSPDVLTSVAEVSDGRILAAGSSRDAAGTTHFTLARYGTPSLPPCQPSVSARSKVVYQTSSEKVAFGRQKLVWKWHGATPSTDFGDPLAYTDFRFCMQDASGAPLLQATLQGAAHFAAAFSAAWRATGTGFKFSDRFGSTDGIAKLVLSAPPAGDGQLKLRMAPAMLAPFGLTAAPPFAMPVVAKLVRNDDHGCFEATFSSASKNETSGFRALSD